MVIIIENQHEDGATWGISFDGYNPDDEFFTPCKSEKEAVKLQRLINDHLRKEYKKHLNDVTTFSTTAGTVVGETLTLTETGADTAIFEGNMELAEASVTAGNSRLEVASGDRVTVFYDDPKGDWGDALQVRDEALYAATVIKHPRWIPIARLDNAWEISWASW